MKPFPWPVVFLASVHFFPACSKDNPVAPLPNNPSALTWTVDTLAHPDNFQASFAAIWGSSAKDVYAVGDANTTRGIMWHFNINHWRDVKISILQGGPIEGTIGLYDVFGFGQDQVFVVGTKLRLNPSPPPNFLHKRLLLYYDGGTWQELPVPFAEGGDLTAIGGESPDDFWIGGRFSNVYHFDGVSASKNSLPMGLPETPGDIWSATSIAGSEDQGLYLHALYPGIGGSYLFEWQAGQWVLVDDRFLPGTWKIWMSPSGTLYAAGSHVYQKQGETWSKILDGDDEAFFARSIYGVADHNFFVVGKGGPTKNSVAYHYNGSSWHRFANIEFANTTFTDVWTDGEQVFLLGDVGVGDMPIALHGK